MVFRRSRDNVARSGPTLLRIVPAQLYEMVDVLQHLECSVVRHCPPLINSEVVYQEILDEIENVRVGVGNNMIVIGHQLLLAKNAGHVPANVRGSPYLLTLSRLSRFLSTTLATEAKYPVRDRAVVCLLTFGDECAAFFAFGGKLENNRVGIVHHCCILPLVCGSCSGLLRLTHRRFSPCVSRTCSWSCCSFASSSSGQLATRSLMQPLLFRGLHCVDRCRIAGKLDVPSFCDHASRA